MDFVAYLISKNIDSQKFESLDQTLYSLWQREFMLMNPKSFTAQKLFAINNVRRKYQLHMGAKPKEKAPIAEKATVATGTVSNEPSTKPKFIPSFKKATAQDAEAIENKEVAPNSVSTINVETHNDLPLENPKKQTAKPVFKRPASSEPTVNEPANTAESSEPIATPVPQKIVAKPVFKRPENTESSSIEEKPLAPTAPEQAIKKAAAKPVFKRPEAKAEEVAQTEPTPNLPTEATENSVEKKVMAKPVFKRPEAKVEEVAQTEPTPNLPTEATGSPVEKKVMVKPVFKRPELPTDDQGTLPTEEKPNTETPPKKTTPRPIFKRPEL